MKYLDFDFFFDKEYAHNILFMSVSGSHAFGWATPKSDLDLRIVWIPDTRQAVSPFYKGEIKHNISEEENLDTTEYPLQDYLRLLNKGNGNVLENLFQEKLLQREDKVKELQQIAMKHLHKGYASHYRGYLQSVKKDLNIPSRIEKYGIEKLVLMGYKCVFSGFAILEKKVMFNINELIKSYTWSNIPSEVLSIYLRGNKIVTPVLEHVLVEWKQLESELDSRINRSDLPSYEESTMEIPLDEFCSSFYSDSRSI